jgi:hypothetical protein
VAKDPIPPAVLDVQWIHSHEEDTPTEMVFRPAGWKFPPARGRDSLRLKADGSLVEGRPGPDDRPAAATGTWRAAGPQTLEVFRGGGVKPAAAKPDRVLDIVSVAKDRLVVRKRSG